MWLSAVGNGRAYAQSLSHAKPTATKPAAGTATSRLSVAWPYPQRWHFHGVFVPMDCNTSGLTFENVTIGGAQNGISVKEGTCLKISHALIETSGAQVVVRP